ncbi:MAG: CehA/McbA family metallohydrolase [Deltaproteobacteria bacterium]|nr:CehA/McbA family metallohydrolase [Deltaproteobacteria bacterium]
MPTRQLLLALFFALLVCVAAAGCPETRSIETEAADAGVTTPGTDGGADAGDASAPDAGPPSLFADGCPVAGKSIAKAIVNPRLRADGPDALGTVGDYLLMNEKAAFVIQGTGHLNTYYYYSGILIDAVALDGCKQASLERFEELWLLFGKLNAAEFASSVLHAFRGDAFEVSNDGSDGRPAIVKVTGADDIFWLVEDELIRASFEDGKPKKRSDPFGVEVEVAYVLPPDSGVLQINVTYRNKAEQAQPLLAGAAAQFGDSTVARYFASGVMSVGGYGIDQGVPWTVASGGDGAWAFAMKNALMGTVNIAGVTALVDLNHIAAPLKLGPAGESGDTARVTYFVSAGGSDSNSAVRSLHEVNPQPVPGFSYTLTPVEGTVMAAEGGPIAGALVEVRAKNDDGEWRVLDSFYTGADGKFSGEVSDFGASVPLRLQALVEGRPDHPPVDLPLPAAGPVTLTVGAGGTLAYDVKDGAGHALPAKILLYQEGSLLRRVFGGGGPGTIALPPGDYEVSVTRGFEYTTYQGNFTVTAGAETRLPVTLDHAVDTTGWMSTDGHAHAGPSADNRIPIPERIRTVAAEGLDVAISTDHEFVSDWRPGIEETGLDGWVATVVGQEVTASIPEHTNIYGGLTPRYDLDARGGYVRWFGHNIAEIYSLERVRGAKVNQFNHPRGYIEMIGYDVTTGLPALEDPTALGLAAGAELWDWDFDAVELQNGPAPIFGAQGEAGMFDYWMSFLNLGHKVTAMGNSDAHDYEIVGTPRDYFPASTEDPRSFSEDELVKAVKEGRVVVSTGAFARILANGSAGVGDLVTDTDGEIDLNVHIEAIPEIDVTYFKVYVNCDQVLKVAAADPAAVVKFDGTVTVPIAKDSHVVAVGFGKNALPRGMSQFDSTRVPRFVTNPVYVDFNGSAAFDPPGGKKCAYDMTGP